MDVDPPQKKGNLEVHPLAIVHMSDQYTRITCGGSPLPKDAPVVGLLFGSSSDDDSLAVLDADDVPLHAAPQDKIQLQVGLHQAVFPTHQVIGWYRVSPDPTPTMQDLETSIQLAKLYPSALLFCATQVGSESEKPKANAKLPAKPSQKDGKIPCGTSTSSPLMVLYQLEDNVLVAMDEKAWALETSEAEQIAVERVVRQQQRNHSSSSYVSHVETVQESLSQMQQRIQILILYLQQTKEGKIQPPNHTLLRQVNELVCQLGPILAASENTTPPPTSNLLLQLAVVAKTVQTIHGYAEKHSKVDESKANLMLRERRYG